MPLRNVQVGLRYHYLNSSRLYHFTLAESLEYLDKKYTKNMQYFFFNLFNIYVVFQSFKTKITKKYISASVIMLLKILQKLLI